MDDTSKKIDFASKKKKVLLKTFGCQMNTYDSQVAAGILEKAGFNVISEGEDVDLWQKKPRHVSSDLAGIGPKASCAPSAGREIPDESLQPDIVLMNTCSVREHAEERVWGRLGMLGVEKKRRPELVIGLMGCMVEEHKEKLFKRFPYLDLIVGTRHIQELPEMIEQVLRTREHVARIKQDGISIEYSEFTKRDSAFHAWLPIMTGCNKACTFCIVPITRGNEVSMPAKEVYREAERLVADGVKWITLLGQNVNSYGQTVEKTVSLRGGQNADEAIAKIAVLTSLARNDVKVVTFPKLLERLCGIRGLERISFTTSHPQDATEELFQVIAKNPKISRRFHLPLQSGSDRILKRMKRFHTYAKFKEKIDRLRALVPEISITSDIIVGFSGETEEDHQATKRALEEIRFDGAFIYKYSVRPGTPAAKLTDDVSLRVKGARNQELLALQKRITEEKNRALLGKSCFVFAERRSDDNLEQIIGRTDQERRVIFETKRDCLGQFVQVELQELKHETFRGKLSNLAEL